MKRRELMLRMIQGEKLMGTNMARPFLLGQSDLARNRVSPEFVALLIEDGLALPVNGDDWFSVRLTDKANDWFIKRNIHFSLQRVNR